jgi:hypothetical protein
MDDAKALSIISSQLGISDPGIRYVYTFQLPSTWWAGLLGPFTSLMMKFNLLVVTGEAVEVLELDMGSHFQKRSSIPYQTIAKVEFKESLLNNRIVIQTQDGNRQEFNTAKQAGKLVHQSEYYQFLKETLARFA